ncbi:MAG: SDR family oxidoreductase, partial [Bacteroidales bacterium]|nr:SDR family oxidoreductase [Bacteroidales bacterium]
MNILITGGAGYIGSTLVPMLLANGHKVRVIDNLMYGGQSLLGFWSHPRFEFIKGDIRNTELLRSSLIDMDAVVHLAAIVGDPACMRNPDIAESVNLSASQSLLDECNNAGVSRFIFASTCSNYGKMEDQNQYVDETSELRPISLYAKSKVSVESLIKSKMIGSCATIVRFATVFGVSPRMRFDLTVNEFTMELLTTNHLTIFGEQFWRPYIHVRDAARAIELVLKSPVQKVKNKIYNVGSTDQNYTKQQLVEHIHNYAPDAVIEYVHKDEDPRDYRVSFAK